LVLLLDVKYLICEILDEQIEDSSHFVAEDKDVCTMDENRQELRIKRVK
jgi:hypothetical protein